MIPRLFAPLVACATVAMLAESSVATTYTPVWFDGFDATASGFDINADLGATRQGGSPIPLAYDTAFATQVGDYHHQIAGGGPDYVLQLAGDVNINTAAPNTQAFHAYASPDNNFDGLTGGGEVIGKKISVTVDTAANYIGDLPDAVFMQSAVTVGSSEKISDSGNKLSGFSVIFIEQTFATANPETFIQIRNAGDDQFNPTGNLIPNPAGRGPANLELFIDDPTDGNPWDGVGQTDIDVVVNGVLVFEFTEGGGGYVDNYITLDGSNQKNVQLDTLATHVFNNLTVFSAPAIPEPASAALVSLAAIGSVIRRKR